ncbi:MAG: hypothetical protein IKE63_00525 [Bacilli bacterium]|nr:hypothetical protein [Bacilli bacterium]
MKDIMGEKIIIFVIGLLLGAVIATGAFVVCTKTCHNKGNRGEIMQLPNGNQPSMNNGQGQNNNQNGQPPAAPSGDNNQNSQPPEKPGESNSQNSTQDNNS